MEQFAYPLGGTGSVYETMASEIRARGGKVMLSTGVRGVITSGGALKSIRLENGNILEYDHVVSTMPISLLVEQLPEVPRTVLEQSRKLTFRNTVLVYLRVDRDSIFPDQWLYIHEPSVEVGRVTNFRNWLPSVYGESSSTILCLEYWCYFEDALWQRKDRTTGGSPN